MDDLRSMGVSIDHGNFPKIESVHNFENGKMSSFNVSSHQFSRPQISSNVIDRSCNQRTHTQHQPSATQEISSLNQPTRPYFNPYPNMASRGLPPIPIPIPVPVPILPPMIPIPIPIPMPMPMPMSIPMPMLNPAMYNEFMRYVAHNNVEMHAHHQRRMMYNGMVRNSGVNNSSSIGRQTKRVYSTMVSEDIITKNRIDVPCKVLKRDSADDNTNSQSTWSKDNRCRLHGSIGSNAKTKIKVEVIEIDGDDDEDEEIKSKVDTLSASKTEFDISKDNKDKHISNSTELKVVYVDVTSNDLKLVNDNLKLNTDDKNNDKSLSTNDKQFIPYHDKDMLHLSQNFPKRYDLLKNTFDVLKKEGFFSSNFPNGLDVSRYSDHLEITLDGSSMINLSKDRLDNSNGVNDDKDQTKSTPKQLYCDSSHALVSDTSNIDSNSNDDSISFEYSKLKLSKFSNSQILIDKERLKMLRDVALPVLVKKKWNQQMTWKMEEYQEKK